jgi:hypothetical protein
MTMQPFNETDVIETPFVGTLVRRYATPKEADPTGRAPNEPGAKLDHGKPLPHLVLGGFSKALEHVVAVGTYGAQKYSPNGWQHVPNGVERYSEAMLRHYFAEYREGKDPDTGLLHAAHLAWNALARLHCIIKELEDNEVRP